MKVLGVLPSSTDVKWALLEGTRQSPLMVSIENKAQRLPAGGDEAQNLSRLKQLIGALLKEKGIEKVAIVQAGHSQFRGPSVTRVKTEAVFQLAAAETNIPVVLVAAKTLKTQEASFAGTVGGTPEAALNSGKPFSPKPWRDAVLAAWVGLDSN